MCTSARGRGQRRTRQRVPPTKEDVYLDLGPRATTAQAQRLNVTVVTTASCTCNGTGTSCSFAVDLDTGIAAGAAGAAGTAKQYAVVAFEDGDGDARLGLASEAVGWYAAGGAHWLTPVAGSGHVAFTVWKATPLPHGPQRHGSSGSFHYVNGVASLQVNGTARQRGYAHGYLLAAQIVDFFRFFSLQATTDSTQQYEAQVAPFMAPGGGWYAYEPDYLDEIDAIIDGMAAVSARRACAGMRPRNAAGHPPFSHP